MNNNLKGQQIQFAKAISGTKFQMMNQCKDSNGAIVHTMKNAVGSRTIEEIDRIIPMRFKYHVVRRAKGVSVIVEKLPKELTDYVANVLKEAGMSDERVSSFIDYTLHSSGTEDVIDVFPLLNVLYFALMVKKEIFSKDAVNYILNVVSFDNIDTEARSFIAGITLYKLNQSTIDSHQPFNKADLIVLKTLANTKFIGKIQVDDVWDVYTLGNGMYFEDYLDWLKGSGF